MKGFKERKRQKAFCALKKYDFSCCVESGWKRAKGASGETG